MRSDDGGRRLESIAPAATTTGHIPKRALEERYRAGTTLGTGGSGQVVLHGDGWTGREVALKRPLEPVRASARMREHFLQEARIQAQLEHPSIVPVYDLGVDGEGHPYFTMRRVQGETLATVIDEAAARRTAGSRDHDPRRLLNAFTRVCLAVQYAHERGVLHRDLKPSNIMLGAFGEVYVLDWGIARVDEPGREGEAEPAAGTPGYIAPEVLAGGAERLGLAVDVYALGAILYEILTLENPHAGDVPQARILSTLTGVTDEAAAALEAAEAPPELAQVCIAALARDPSERPSSARALHDAVEAFLAGERDLELRRGLAAEHAERAEVRSRSGAGLAGRKEAMREIGRALALDPGNQQALATMVHLLESPPDEVPEDIHEASGQSHRLRLQAIGRFAALTYAGMLTFLPLVILAGMRDAAPFIAFFGGCALASVICGIAAARGSDALAMVAMVVSCAATAATTGLYGPMVIMPQALIINVVLYCFTLAPRYTAPTIAVGLAAISVPFALELLGVTHAYAVAGGQVLIAEQGIVVGRTSMLLFGLAAAVFGLLSGTLAAVFYQRRLRAIERQLLLQHWHLRQMIAAPEDPARG